MIDVHCMAGAEQYPIPGTEEMCKAACVEGMTREGGLSAEKPEQAGYGLMLQVELNLSLVLLKSGAASSLLSLAATCFLLSPCVSSDTCLPAQCAVLIC